MSCGQACNQGRTCDCIDITHQARIAASKAAYEAGNYYPPVPDDEVPLTGIEATLIYTMILIGCAISLALFIGGLDFVFQLAFN